MVCVEMENDIQLLKTDYIFKSSDGYKVLNPSIYNYPRIFKYKDIFIYLNYSTIINYYFYLFLFNYKGKNEIIKNIIELIKSRNESKLNEIVKKFIADKSLFNIILKYYPTKIKLDLNTKNIDLFNHIHVHYDKIFTENNVLKIIKNNFKSIKDETNLELSTILNSDIIKGFKCEPSNLHEKNLGVDLWLYNNTYRYSVKAIDLNDGEYDIVTHNGVIKIIIDNIKSNIYDYKLGNNTIRYKYICIHNVTNKNIVFINTSVVESVSNRKLDKQVSIQFNMTLISDMKDLTKYVKKYNY